MHACGSTVLFRWSHKVAAQLSHGDELFRGRGVNSHCAVEVRLRRAHLDRHRKALQHLVTTQAHHVDAQHLSRDIRRCKPTSQHNYRTSTCSPVPTDLFRGQLADELHPAGRLASRDCVVHGSEVGCVDLDVIPTVLRYSLLCKQAHDCELINAEMATTCRAHGREALTFSVTDDADGRV